MINDDDKLYPADPKDCFYYRTLFDIFKVYTTPKLKRVLEANNIRYFVDGKGKHFAHRDDVYGSKYGQPVSDDTVTPTELRRAPEEPVPTETPLGQ